jgi:benzylsuccinate CoA-transferase BbsF subunit
MAEIPYVDYTAGEHTVFAVMTALMNRLRTGQGQFIDVSQAQAAAVTIPEVLLDFAANGREPERIGNADPVMAPHGCYPCRGEDRWIVIAVSDDEEWQGLCRVLGRPEWAADPRLSGGLGRWRAHEKLDQMMPLETAGWDAHELMSALQAQGVPAGAVLDSKDLLFDPHLRERGFYEVVRHHPSTDMPPLPYAGRPWKLSETPAVPPMAAPLMGEHNGYVLGELLGMSADEVAGLEENGIIGYAPNDPRPVQRPSLDEQVRQGRMLRYESDFESQVSQAYPLLPEG